MLRPMPVSWLIALLCVAPFASAQGGAGGFGQGSAGGYGQRGMGGGGGFPGAPPGAGRRGPGRPGAEPAVFADEAGIAINSNLENSRPEDEGGDLWETRTAVLTPGDRVEYKFKVRKGETLLASASSDSFDPALAVVDIKGVELAKNDDREEGDQSPFLICRFPEAGTYTLKVLSYRSVSGGKYTVKFRTFVASDAAVGPVVHEHVIGNAGQEDGDRPSRVEFRLSAKKGKIYDLLDAGQFQGTQTYREHPVRILGPTGVEKNDFTLVQTPDGSAVFQALADGDYYIEYNWTGTPRYRTNYREVTATTMKASGEVTLDLGQAELKLVDFPVTPDLIVRTTLSAPSALYLMTAPNNPNIRDEAGGDPAYGTSQSWTWFKIDVESDRDVVRVFHGKGTARIAVRSTNGSGAQKVAIVNSESLPAWTSGAAIKDALGVGESKLFVLKSTKSELMRVDAGTSHFQLKLDIFRTSGELANSLMNRKTHTVHDDLYFPDANTFVIRISCEGHGGSGDFTMQRQPPKTTPYTLGTSAAMKLDGGNFFLYTVNLVAGKRYELITDRPQRADLVDEDGTFLTSPSVFFDQVEVQYFVPKRSGPHRLWLRGEPAVVHFKLQLNVPPKVGI